jgi:hypothetical protein
MDSDLIVRQRRLFALAGEFFERVAGESAQSFAARGPFDEIIKQRAQTLARRGQTAYAWFEEQARSLYSANWRDVFRDARNAAGMKLVLGGANRLSGSHVGSIQKMLLYTDCLLVPDPILPWLETDRSEERFRHVHLLKQVFWLLHLKPLIDSDLPYPAVLIFPSWEKRLEKHDSTTQERQFALTTSVVNQHIGTSFGDIDELRQFAINQPTELLTAVDKSRIFLAPGADTVEPLDAGIERYLDHVRTWRSAEHVATLERFPRSILVLYAIMERLGPQYHMLENAEELRAQPMMSIPAHWHYHRLISQTFEGQLVHSGSLSKATVSTLRALDQPGHEWLGNVPIGSLVELRQNNENETFRTKLSGYTSALHEAELDEIDRVAAEVGRGLAAMLVEHRKEVRRIADRYKLEYTKTLAGGVVTAAATFMPALAPFVGGLVAPLALAGAYAYSKTKERAETRRAARSLTGVLATAHKAAG